MTPADGAAARQVLTPQEAVDRERSAWMRHTRALIKNEPNIAWKLFLVEHYLDWGKGRAARCQSRPGGLGRTKKK